MAAEGTIHSILRTEVPVLVPPVSELAKRADVYMSSLAPVEKAQDTTPLVVRLKDDAEVEKSKEKENASPVAAHSAFMDGLRDRAVPTLDGQDNKTFTQNNDVTYRTAGHIHVDLLNSMNKGIKTNYLDYLLAAGWELNPDITLKLIWNARSIHVGKGDRTVFYQAIGWLYEHHPRTLLENLQWLVRPVIAKKLPSKEQKQDEQDQKEIAMVKPEDADDDFEVINVDDEFSEEAPRKKVKLDEEAETEDNFEEKYGVAHGYWKDLLNLVALAVNDELKIDGDVRKILNPSEGLNKNDRAHRRLDRWGRKNARRAKKRSASQAKPQADQSESQSTSKPPEDQQPWERNWSKGGMRKARREASHEKAMQKLKDDAKYTTLYLTVARLFAEQLKVDKECFEGGDAKQRKAITLCAKWAPSHQGLHDKNTFIVSTIAELIDEHDQWCPKLGPDERALYYKYARMAYQAQTLSGLRKHLNIVERPITEEEFEDIKYERVPSLAMQQYSTSIFAKKDAERFEQYLDSVAEGKSKISGAILLPQTFVHQVRNFKLKDTSDAATVAQRVGAKVQQLELKTIEGQWKTLVQRIKDSGTLSSSIAICDVSGSMNVAIDKDVTAMDASIGLSLLIAEVTEPPFGGAFITFSNDPEVVRVGGQDDKRSFKDKVRYIERSFWSMSTDFVAVFERLILPMARERNLSQEDMVKRVFVFSDMQFNSADHGPNRWSTSYQRIMDLYRSYGYELPELVFWNLYGGAQYGSTPVTAEEPGCSLISGFSQGMLKVFLDEGAIDSEAAQTKDKNDGGTAGEEKKAKTDPLATVMKVVSHQAYRMLKVVD